MKEINSNQIAQLASALRGKDISKYLLPTYRNSENIKILHNVFLSGLIHDIKFRETSCSILMSGPGVYMLVSFYDPRLVYIGQSDNMWNRYVKHIRDCKNGDAAIKVQEHYDTYKYTEINGVVDDKVFFMIPLYVFFDGASKEELEAIEAKEIALYKNTDYVKCINTMDYGKTGTPVNTIERGFSCYNASTGVKISLFNTMSNAASTLNIPRRDVNAVLIGEQRTTHGYYFSYTKNLRPDTVIKKTHEPYICEECGVSFMRLKGRGRAKYCSNKCKKSAFRKRHQ